MNVYDIFDERGFIEQVTDAKLVRELLQDRKISFYIGFDPTATSLHVGSLVPIMALMQMQRGGHHPIVLIGGGTGLIGDPSGKTEMRQILTLEQIRFNAQCLQSQLSRYLDFGAGKAMMVNNADWLTRLNYIEFLRDIGRHFSVNKMLSAESYKLRLEKGLNFIEFNYMLLQAYDFWYLFKHYDCLMQMGGNDQWGNVLAGVDLVRRIEGRMVFGLTFPLLTTSQGHKMGKTEKGTVWLDPQLTSPYEYYQYWANVDDADVERFLALFTFLPMVEVRQTRKLKDVDINMAKSVLAYEATKITHGEAEATAAWQAAHRAFNVRFVDAELFPSATIPREAMHEESKAIPSLIKASGDMERGIPAFELFAETGLCSSRGEARRLIAQGGGYVNEIQIKGYDENINLNHVDKNGDIRLRKGKKHYFIVHVK